MSHSPSVLEAHRFKAEAAGRVAAVWPALLAALFGILILYGVGFAGPTTIHNAAHDSRHAFAFPCH